KRLKKRDDQGKFWWELRSCAYYKEFERPKIIWGNLATIPQFTMDYSKAYVSAPANIIPGDDFYLLGILNSHICRWIIALEAAVRAGGFLEFKPMYVEKIPIVDVPSSPKIPIISLAKKILANPDSPEVPQIEKEIDTLVYELYGLTEDEIAIVEGKNNDEI
ncbi:MAG: class I SAM-dependent DNA methyltransferase, partial [Nitrospiraceae bacterium]|nr:class I SAM-dependent DNA methyltransferase [Nitrospiraceae bacterium]